MFLTKPILPVNPVSDAEAMSTFQQTRTPNFCRGQLKLIDNRKIEMFDPARLHSPGQYPSKHQGSSGLLVTKYI
jgi:hypothetical protein